MEWCNQYIATIQHLHASTSKIIIYFKLQIIVGSCSISGFFTMFPEMHEIAHACAETHASKFTCVIYYMRKIIVFSLPVLLKYIFLCIKTTTVKFIFKIYGGQSLEIQWYNLYLIIQWILKNFRNADFPILLLVIWGWTGFKLS